MKNKKKVMYQINLRGTVYTYIYLNHYTFLIFEVKGLRTGLVQRRILVQEIKTFPRHVFDIETVYLLTFNFPLFIFCA